MLTPESHNKGRLTLLAAATLGAFSIAAQALSSREALAVLAGNELVVGLVFSLWHVGLVLGALTAGRVQSGRLLRLTPLLLLAAAFATPTCIYFLRICRSWSGVAAGEQQSLPTLLLVLLLTIAPQSALFGALFPAICQDTSGASGTTSHFSIARVYGVEALASLAAGILLTTLLLPLCGLAWTAVGASLMVLLVAAWLALWHQQRGMAVLALLCSTALVLAGLLGAVDWLDGHSRDLRFHSISGGYEKQSEQDSHYQNLVLATPPGRSASDRGRGRQLVLFANGQHTMSIPDPYHQAQRVHLVLAQHPHPKSILIVGGGSIGVLDEIFLHGVASVDYVELDPAILRALDRWPNPQLQQQLRDPRLTTVNSDARRYIASTTRRYDLVFVDQPAATSAMQNRVFSKEFFAQVRQILTGNGALVVASSTAETYMGALVVNPTAAIFKALRAVFPYVVATPGSENYLAASSQADLVTVEPERLRTRLRQRHLQSQYFSPQELIFLLPPERAESLRQALISSTSAANSDLTPVTYFHNLLLLAHKSAQPLAPLLLWAQQLSPWQPAVLLLLPSLLLAFFRRLGRRASPTTPALWALMASGFSSSALSLLLLLAYQNSLGVLYNAIALLVGLFMLGLGGGSLGCALAQQRGYLKPANALLCSELLNLVLALAAAPVVLGAAELGPSATTVLLGTALIVCGGAAGLAFSSTTFVLRGSPQRLAAAADAADCAGAAGGSLLAALVALPLFGVVTTAVLLGVLKLGTLIVVLENRGQNR